VTVAATVAHALQTVRSMPRIMDALELLVGQHEAIGELLAKTAAATEAAEKMEVFCELIDKLVAHAEVEEELFFPCSRAPWPAPRAAAELECAARARSPPAASTDAR
jgi:hypothetical protein